MLFVLSARLPRANIYARDPLILMDLHWLPVERRIEYKIATICYSVITCTAPPYLSDLLELYTPSRTLRSSADNCIFHISNKRKIFQGERAFSFVGPSVLNSLPFSVRQAQILFSFKSQLYLLFLTISSLPMVSLSVCLSVCLSLCACV